MIISHKHKFIFIKPQKTAGTSVELLLSRICGDKDIITPFGFDPNPNVRIINNAKHPQNYFRKKPLKHFQISEVYHHFFKNSKVNSNYKEHLNAEQIRHYIGNEIWDSYKKISIVRNPWDHAVSWYKWRESRGKEVAEKNGFENYLINNYKTTWPFYTVNHGLYDIDFMIRFESINEDIQILLKKLNIKTEMELPKTKNKNRQNMDYQVFFTNKKAIDIVHEKSFHVINKFKYTFDKTEFFFSF